MKVTITATGEVSITKVKSSPERIKKLMDSVQIKYGIKNLTEFAKLFDLEPKSGARAIKRWRADKSTASHLEMPWYHYELLLNLAGEGELIIKKEQPIKMIDNDELKTLFAWCEANLFDFGVVLVGDSTHYHFKNKLVAGFDASVGAYFISDNSVLEHLRNNRKRSRRDCL